MSKKKLIFHAINARSLGEVEKLMRASRQHDVAVADYNKLIGHLEAQIKAGVNVDEARIQLQKFTLESLKLEVKIQELNENIGRQEQRKQMTYTFSVNAYLSRFVASHFRRRPEYEYVPPPRLAQFVLLLVPHKDRESLLGDLEEEYRTIVLPEHGARKARLYYWWHVACSVRPLLWAKIKYIAGFILLMRSMK